MSTMLVALKPYRRYQHFLLPKKPIDPLDIVFDVVDDSFRDVYNVGSQL